MSGIFPTSTKYTASTLRSIHNNYIAVQNGLNTLARTAPGHAFEFTLSTIPMTRADFAPIQALIEAQQGAAGTFSVDHPNYITPQGSPSGTPIIQGASQTGKSITTDGWTPSTNGLLKAGDIVKFSNSTKVYMLTQDVNSDVSGNATLYLNTSVVTSPIDNSTVSTSNIAFTVRLKSNIQEYATNNVNHFTYELVVTEAF